MRAAPDPLRSLYASRAVRYLVALGALGLGGCYDVTETPDSTVVTWDSLARYGFLAVALVVVLVSVLVARALRRRGASGALWIMLGVLGLFVWFVPKLFFERVTVTSEAYLQETLNFGIPSRESFAFRDVHQVQLVDRKSYRSTVYCYLHVTLVGGREERFALTSLATRSRSILTRAMRRHGVRLLESPGHLVTRRGRALDEPLAADVPLVGRVYVDRGSAGDRFLALQAGGHLKEFVRTPGGPSLRAALDQATTTIVGAWQTTVRSGPRDVTLALTFAEDGTFRYVAGDAESAPAVEGTYELLDDFLSFTYPGGVTSWQRRAE